MAKYTLEQLEDMVIKGFRVMDERQTALEVALSNTKGSGFKIDYKAKLKASPEMLQALKNAISQCLPLQKSTKWTDKEGVEKSFSSLKDYQEATNVAIKSNGLSITFDENKEAMELVTNIVLLVTNERRSITTQVKLANKPDPEQAKTFGFMNAKGKMLGNLMELK